MRFPVGDQRLAEVGDALARLAGGVRGGRIGGTQGVGRATTQAVVVSSIWIIVTTFFIGRIFLYLG